MKGLLLFIMTLIASCALPGIDPAPYLVTKITVITGEGEGYCLGTVEVMLLNKEDQEITSLNIEFDLYDLTGLAQPQAGQNHVKVGFDESIPPGEEVTLHVVLDSLFTCFPPDPLTISRFCITRIGYADGSSWTDRLRLNLIMEDRVTVINLRDELKEVR